MVHLIKTKYLSLSLRFVHDLVNVNDMSQRVFITKFIND